MPSRHPVTSTHLHGQVVPGINSEVGLNAFRAVSAQNRSASDAWARTPPLRSLETLHRSRRKRVSTFISINVVTRGPWRFLTSPRHPRGRKKHSRGAVIFMSQVMSHFLPNTTILSRKRGSQPELSRRKITGAQPKHHFRNPMLYPFELRALRGFNPLKQPRLVYRTRFAICSSDQPRSSCYPEPDLK